MTTVLIVIHLMVVVAMIGLVLLQRSEGGALGIGGGGGGAFMSGRGAANVLTRSTGILAAVFFATSIGLALLARMEAGPSDIFQNLPGQTAPTTSETPAPPIPSGGGTAEEMLQQLPGAASPQTAPEESSGAGETLPVPEGGAAPTLGGGASPQAPPTEGGGQ